MEKLVGYVKVPVYVGDDGVFYTKETTSQGVVPVEEEED